MIKFFETGTCKKEPIIPQTKYNMKLHNCWCILIQKNTQKRGFRVLPTITMQRQPSLVTTTTCFSHVYTFHHHLSLQHTSRIKWFWMVQIRREKFDLHSNTRSTILKHKSLHKWFACNTSFLTFHVEHNEITKLVNARIPPISFE